MAGYNNQNAEVISRAFTANLVIDGRQILTHFLFCDTGRHDVLIGRKWFEKTRVLIDCFNRKLIWPDEAQYQASKDLVVPRQELRPPEAKPEHQADVNRRDRLHKAAIPTQILKRAEKDETVQPGLNERQARIIEPLRKSVLQLRAQPKTWRAQQLDDTNEMEK